MGRIADLGAALQSGERGVEFVDRRRTWFVISAVLLLISLIGLGVRQLDLGVEFDGGSVFDVRSATADVDQIREIVEDAGAEEPTVQQLGGDRFRIETTAVTVEDAEPIQQGLSEELGVPLDSITTQTVGPSWGEDVTKKALFSLAIFLALLLVYLALTFEPKMAVGAMAALLHDLLLTIGIYAIVGFVVTPATVIGLLTILGYSLYDTVVVFDKVRENTANLTKQTRYTYSGAANLAVNQTLVRSVNTTVIALLPVAGLLFVGAGLLGAGTLKDLALVLFVGMAVGAYSSLCISTPVTAALKEREPAMKAHAKRVAQRDAAVRKQVATKVGAGTSDAVSESRPDAGSEAGSSEVSEHDAPAGLPSARAGTPGERVQPKRGGSRSSRRPSGRKRP